MVEIKPQCAVRKQMVAQSGRIDWKCETLHYKAHMQMEVIQRKNITINKYHYCTQLFQKKPTVSESK